MLNKTFEKKKNAKFFFSWSEEKSKRVRSTETADGFTKMFQNGCRAVNGKGVLKLCFETSFLSWTLLRFCVNESFVEKALDLITDLILVRKGRGVGPLFGGHYSRSAQTRQWFKGTKHSLLISISHSSKMFWILGGLERANFGLLEVFLWNSLWTWNQYSFEFIAFLELKNSDVISFISDNFPGGSTIMKAKNRILTFQYLSIASSNSFETSECACLCYFILNNHIGLKWIKCLYWLVA